MPRENGQLSSEALHELLKVVETSKDSKEREYALQLYKVETTS